MKFMKYIKTFENRVLQKFNEGDPVKITGDDTIYVVDGYDYRQFKIKDVCRLKKYEDKDKLANREGFYSWQLQDLLIKATDEEINEYLIKKDANKYNL